MRDTLIEVPEPPHERTGNLDAVPALPHLPRNAVQVGAIAPGAIPRGRNSPPKKMDNGRFLSVMVDEDDKKLLAALSAKRGVSLSSLTRQALKDYLAPLRDKEKTRV